jgi:hypothetical protein
MMPVPMQCRAQRAVSYLICQQMAFYEKGIQHLGTHVHVIGTNKSIATSQSISVI